MPSFAAIGRVCLGAAVAGSGLMQLVNRDFVRLVPKLPAWAPAPGLWPVVVGALLLRLSIRAAADRRLTAEAEL